MEERRQGMKELEQKIDAIVTNQATIKNYIEHQFGSVDLAGNAVEGRITEALRHLNEKVAIQNGRVKKLEASKTYIIGACAAITGMFGLVITIIMLFKK